MKALFALTKAEIKISFRNKEALVFSYIIPLVVLGIIRIFNSERLPVFSGLLFTFLLVTAFFGMTDWIVILRSSNLFRRFERLNPPKSAVWGAFFISRLVIISIQVILLLILGILFYGFKGPQHCVGILSAALVASIPLIMLGIILAAPANEKSVRPICGMSVLAGVFLSGAYFSQPLEIVVKIGRCLPFQPLLTLVHKGFSLESLTQLQWLNVGIWTALLAILNLLLFKNVFYKK
jgi:hypothetical protein